METNNLLNQGMDSDISKFFLAKDKYLQAYNFRAITELGESGGGLVNIRGNECAVQFPTMRGTYKLAPKINTPTTVGDTTTITINGQTTASLTINSSTTGEDIYNAIILLSNCYQNPLAVNPTFSVAWKDDYVIISQIPVYVDCTRTDSSPITITRTPSGGAVNFLNFWQTNGTMSTTQVLYLVVSAPSPGPAYITTNKIIGHTFILDDIYLFTADSASSPTNPVNDTFTGPGAIWKLNYNESTRVTTLTLLYYHLLDFNQYFPIAPSAATGRYESTQIQRIYWTDFYNKVRTANVADPQLMALNPKLLSIIPSVGFDIPVQQGTGGGSLGAGTYELCYRLKQSLGAISNYSQLSTPISITTGSLHSGWIPDFITSVGVAAGTNTGKSITWKISHIDTKFDIIEYIITYRSNLGDVPTVYSILEEPIPSSGEKTLTVSTLAAGIEIPLTEFLTLASTFTHAKTVDTKDNRLFWGNVRNKTSEINYDARAFRALTTNGGTGFNNDDCRLKHDGLFTTYTAANAALTPKTNDSINEYYDPTTGTFSTNACYYKPGAAYQNGRPVLGGIGANISYEFGTYSNVVNTELGVGNGDNSYNVYNSWLQNTIPFQSPTQGAVDGFTLINNITSSASENQVFKDQLGMEAMNHPLVSTILRGFQHEEIYRFGIQFYDLEGNPYFTEWIGDIKMPTHADYNNNPDAKALGAMGAANADFRTSFFLSGTTYTQTLYVKFTIDVSSIKDRISGYRIVRVDRQDIDNKTILGCGAVTSTFAENAQNDTFLPSCFYNSGNGTVFPTPAFPGGATQLGNHWRPAPNQESWETLSLNNAAGNNVADKVKTFDTFDFLVDNPGFVTGDRLYIRSRIDSINYQRTGTNFVGYRKWFTGSDWYGLTNTNNLKPGNTASASGAGLVPTFTNPGALDGSATRLQTGLDTGEMAYYLHMYVNGTSWQRAGDLAANSAVYNKTINAGQFVAGAQSASFASSTFNNWGATFDATAGGAVVGGKPCFGAATFALEFSAGWQEFNATYGCNAGSNAGKILALYYRPNVNQYGGNTYTARSSNEYISCGSYIPIIRDNVLLDTTNENNTLLTIDTFGGDVFTTYWDHQKAFKGDSSGTYGPTFNHYRYSPASGNSPGDVGATLGITSSEANNSVTYYLPCTTFHNAQTRDGRHVNRDLVANYYEEDEDLYYNYHSNQQNIVKYFPKPAIFVNTNEWVNRIYYSEVKFNNELQDSWQAYKTNNFYDVEGNYGPINCLISLKEQIYYIQERCFGYLMVNPITTISGDNGLPVTLGKGATIEKHQNLALDIGTKHQWSVYRSQSAITFVDVRTKKIYMYDGTLKPLSDINGQRNFVIKRLHPDLIATDNPIIKKGIVTTYDYYHNEFLYSFINDSSTNDNDENYTLVYSEPIGKFTGLYSFVPPIYLNNNRYLFTVDKDATGSNIGKIWVHNYGAYCSFYGTVNDSMIKVLVNDNPMYTKVFDNLSWNSQSIVDNVIWVDDLITPNSNPSVFTATDNVNHIDDTFSSVRCYNEWENTDWTTLTLNSNLKKREQNWSIVIPRNKVNYDINTPPVNIFSSAVLTKTDFGERMRDKYLVVDLRYTNTPNRRFIVHNLKTTYRISAR